MSAQKCALLLALVLVNVLLTRSETKKSWSPKPAMPQEYLRSMESHTLEPKTARPEDETTRFTRSLDTTTFEGSTESEEDFTTSDEATEETDDPTTTETPEPREDQVKRAVRLLVTGRGKKNNWVERLVPLFILPFLIQSAIVPFIVQTIKLLLLKSLFVGKTALLLFLLGVFRNMSKTNRAGGGGGVPYYLKEVGPVGEGPDDRLYHPGPSYVPDIGYRVDGRPDYVSRSAKGAK